VKIHPTLVIIPAFNEAASLPAVLADLRTCGDDLDWLVVDDASGDDTAKVARAMGAKVITLPLNMGVGGAVQAGYIYAYENGYDFAVQFDGDGQHRAKHLGELLEPLRLGRADMVIGSRYLDGVRYRQRVSRQVGSRAFSFVLKIFFGQKFTDPTSGFRAVNRPMLGFFARHYPQGWLGDTIEALVEAARHGFVIREIPVAMRQRKHGTSAANFLKGAFSSCCVLLAIFIDMFEKKHPHHSPCQAKEEPCSPK
jgi:glycosyltransferase involved in cell wall biosynthesis